jgi:chitodextrinase
MYRKCLVLLLMSVVITTTLCVIVDARPSQPGKEWVRSHAFTTSAMVHDPPSWNVNTYKAANFNSSHPWHWRHTILVQSSQSNGLMWHCSLHAASSLTTTIIDAVNNLSTPTQDNGWYVRDEPPSSEFPGIAEVVNWLKANRPNALIYLGTANFSDSYLDSLITQIAPDALSYCNYPFFQDSTQLSNWYDAVRRMRNKTLYHGIPMFAWIQAFAGTHFLSWRAPTEGEVRLLVFTSLTAGAKGVFYFLYARDGMSDPTREPYFTYAITDLGGVPNSLYYQIQGINTQVNNVGKALKYLNSTDIRYVRGGSNPVPGGLTNWSYGAGGISLITNVQVDPGQTGAEKDGFIGFFNDDTGKKYFMLTNAYRSGALNFSITFDASVNQITRLNRNTGAQEVLNLNNHVLNLNLPAGTGDLFCMTTNGFDLGPPTGSVAINGGAAATGSRSVTLTIAASDDKGVTHMRFSHDMVQWTTWETYSNVKPWTLTSGYGTKIVYAQFKDAVGTMSSIYSDDIQFTDLTPPSVPTNVQASAQSASSVQVTWTASTDNVGVTGYRVFRNGSEIGTTAGTSYADTGLDSGVTYSYSVSAYDAAGNESAQSSPPAAVATPDNVSPSIPGNVQAVAQSPVTVQLAWTASTDNVGVTGYRVFRDGLEIGTSATTNYTDSGLEAETTYSYTVSAYDAAGNESLQSSPAAVVATPEAFGAGQKGVTGGIGLNNIGLLVRLWGQFIYVDASSFLLDDGGGTPVKSIVPPDVMIDPEWQYVGVTGISSCYKSGDDIIRLLKIRCASDIAIY